MNTELSLLISHNFFFLQMSESDRLAYYEKAMKAGLNSRLQVPFFTTVGKMRVMPNKNMNIKMLIMGPYQLLSYHPL